MNKSSTNLDSMQMQ